MGSSCDDFMNICILFYLHPAILFMSTVPGILNYLWPMTFCRGSNFPEIPQNYKYYF